MNLVDCAELTTKPQDINTDKHFMERLVVLKQRYPQNTL